MLYMQYIDQTLCHLESRPRVFFRGLRVNCVPSASSYATTWHESRAPFLTRETSRIVLSLASCRLVWIWNSNSSFEIPPDFLSLDMFTTYQFVPG